MRKNVRKHSLIRPPGVHLISWTKTGSAGRRPRQETSPENQVLPQSEEAVASHCRRPCTSGLPPTAPSSWRWRYLPGEFRTKPLPRPSGAQA